MLKKNQEDKTVKTRFAPSPTGQLHVGGARTALFAYLFAKNKGGDFYLRIEDTDRERYVEGADQVIIDSLNWLGIPADNNDDPVVQSESLELYKKHAFELVNQGKAYICTCSKEDLARDRELQEKQGRPPRYEGHCRTADIKISDMAEEGYVIRAKMPDKGKIIVPDMVRGNVEFDASVLDDQIILKSDGYPTYHLASVVDDSEMGITHVIRAEEWLSSTPKHLVLYEMMGLTPPRFAHLPMILGPDKKKLSKRHGATSLLDYREEGFLPEAMVNFMALLGWNPKDDREEFTLRELVAEFSLDNVNKSPAVFDRDKLLNINAEKLKNLEIKELKKRVISVGLEDMSDAEAKLVQRGGYSTLKEAKEYIEKLRQRPDYEADLLVFRKSDEEKTKLGLVESLTALGELSEDSWSEDNINSAVKSVVEKTGLSNGDVFWPVRAALSGEKQSPSPAELAEVLGKNETLERVKEAVERLN